MATAAQLLSAPQADGPKPDPQGGDASPAPAQPEGQSLQMVSLVRNIVSSARQLGKMVPGAVPIVQQINDLAQQLQMQIIKSGPGPEPQAPPV